jgi:hypothetical protein
VRDRGGLGAGEARDGRWWAVNRLFCTPLCAMAEHPGRLSGKPGHPGLILLVPHTC